ncbi:ATP-dependent Clp protease proteolytic subunit (chromatophore) [Paulinella micropora]|uniref:ATP-dependent Clp protease proteolytic subunit n=1 Tax=Paulinella micropora TaxID=1928728 RepID=A0A1L5YB28_9EUKA|nr:ATP-dependent Clp protease proteolytic subunit [Paulinella micropora]APP87904.1 ATP-dependent Clp protease proteolytic subunit [Paulinella micropora]AQX44671.1 ATP-dependent Clp protease proteolytic subunit [Paulinella micropora]AXY63062.1 ATP-dependent Clp protease proteolytic subunit [Paulinella micropora]BBL85878.1 ATP-dependent Clp protease proteolytic subunit [Paulinella micropora]
MPIGYPTIEFPSGSGRYADPVSALSLERILYITSEVEDYMANQLVANLLFFNAQSVKDPIYLYINSDGGSISSGLAIYDTINYITAPVITVCLGTASSMAAFLLAAGQPGERCALMHSRIMIHQPMGGTGRRQASDLLIEASEMAYIKRRMNECMAEMTGQTVDKIDRDTDRDYYLSAHEAVRYGIIDYVI